YARYPEPSWYCGSRSAVGAPKYRMLPMLFEYFPLPWLPTQLGFVPYDDSMAKNATAYAGSMLYCLPHFTNDSPWPAAGDPASFRIWSICWALRDWRPRMVCSPGGMCEGVVL